MLVAGEKSWLIKKNKKSAAGGNPISLCGRSRWFFYNLRFFIKARPSMAEGCPLLRDVSQFCGSAVILPDRRGKIGPHLFLLKAGFAEDKWREGGGEFLCEGKIGGLGVRRCRFVSFI